MVFECTGARLVSASEVCQLDALIGLRSEEVWSCSVKVLVRQKTAFLKQNKPPAYENSVSLLTHSLTEREGQKRTIINKAILGQALV